jgi:hypothetical protein
VKPRLWSAILCLWLAALLGSTAAMAQAPPAEAPADDESAKRARAKERFDAGNKLLQERRFELALGEFTRSLEILPTRAATENAAVCLRELGRADEALGMFEKVLAFPDLPDDVRARVEPQIAELRPLVGSIVVQGGEPGAVVSIDGLPRGKLPMQAAVRARVGLRTVRVHLEGYVPFVQTVDVKPEGTLAVTAKLEVLARAGRLKVTEKNGVEASVVIDNVVVGTTPWEGALSPGDHAVWLRGKAGEGTAPAKAAVLVGQRADVALEIITLDADLDVVATPPSATVAIDGVPVGTASWLGRLPVGRFTVVVSAPGYITQKQVLSLKQDAKKTLRIDLLPVVPPKAEEKPTPPRVELGANGAFAVAPLFYGAPCDDPCSAGVGLGMHIEAMGGYRFSSGFGLGGAAGYVRIEQTVEKRPYGLAPPGRPAQDASADDSVLLSGATIMAQASMRVGARFFASFEAEAGGFFGAVRDERILASRGSAGDAYSAGPYFASGTAAGFSALARVRGGIVVVEGLEAWIGAAPLILVPVERPTFVYGDPVPAGSDGAAELREEPILDDVIVAVTPSIGVAAVFE